MKQIYIFMFMPYYDRNEFTADCYVVVIFFFLLTYLGIQMSVTVSYPRWQVIYTLKKPQLRQFTAGCCFRDRVSYSSTARYTQVLMFVFSRNYNRTGK